MSRIIFQVSTQDIMDYIIIHTHAHYIYCYNRGRTWPGQIIIWYLYTKIIIRFAIKTGPRPGRRLMFLLLLTRPVIINSMFSILFEISHTMLLFFCLSAASLDPADPLARTWAQHEKQQQLQQDPAENGPHLWDRNGRVAARVSGPSTTHARTSSTCASITAERRVKHGRRTRQQHGTEAFDETSSEAAFFGASQRPLPQFHGLYVQQCGNHLTSGALYDCW